MSSSVRFRSLIRRRVVNGIITRDYHFLSRSTTITATLSLTQHNQHKSNNSSNNSSRTITTTSAAASMYTLTASPTSPASIGCSIGYGGDLLKSRRLRGPSKPPSPTAAPSPPNSIRSNSSSSSPPPPSSSSNQYSSSDFEPLENILPESPRSGDKDLWYVITAACLIAWRKEPAVADLWRHISTSTTPTPSEEDLLKTARRLREGLLKASVLVGFPRAINGLSHLSRSIKEHTPSIGLALTDDASLRSPVAAGVKEQRGRDFFGVLYDKHADLVLANMASTSGGDLSYYAVASVYGELMAETRILGGADTGLLELACCIAAGCTDQAKGHMYGSRNLGAKGAEVRGTIMLVFRAAQIFQFPDISEYFHDMPFLEKPGDWE